MKIENDATPPIPLHALEEYLYEMKQRGSVLDLAGKRGCFFLNLALLQKLCF